MPDRYVLPARLIDLNRTVELRSPYTHDHAQRVAGLAIDIAHTLGLPRDQVERIAAAARVHDVGKIAVPIAILMKPGKLTLDEEAVMQRHAAMGATMVYPYLPELKAAIRGHHERWDGAGYPDRLCGLDIPLEARIIAVADSWDAITADRPYRLGMSVVDALAVLQGGRGTQWDADLVDVFMAIVEQRKRRPPRSGASEHVAAD